VQTETSGEKGKVYWPKYGAFLHFKESELACKCGCGLNNATSGLLFCLEEIHTAVNPPNTPTPTPVIIRSACRCPKHNAAVGGAPNSQHLRGCAADIHVPGRSAAELEAIASGTHDIHGIGVPDVGDWIHADVRRAPIIVRWRYDRHGREKPWDKET
jgi:hypothetical protein